jgi:glc operon protein GlcG
MINIFIRILAFWAVTCLFSGSASAAQLISRNALTLEVAKQMAAVSMQDAIKQKGLAVIVVMDDGGHLIYLERMDDAPLGSIDVAIGKARSVVMYQRPTEVFQKMMEEGHTNVLGISGLVPWGGGVPVMWQGHMIGAIAVSGMSPEQDAAAASLAANAISGIVGH